MDGKGPRPIFVHLGNVGLMPGISAGFEKAAARSRKYAQSLPNARIIGIDLAKYKPPADRPNLEQIHADFAQGLEQLQDGSVRRVSSDIALGHYDLEGNLLRDVLDPVHSKTVQWYTTRVADLAYDKLEPRGRLEFTVKEHALLLACQALAESRFGRQVRVVKMTPMMRQRSYWNVHYAYDENNPDEPVYQIIARKPEKS